MCGSYECPCVVIGYDSRIQSDKFARIASEVFAANSVGVYLWPQLTPVPTVSFAVRYLSASAGVMIMPEQYAKALAAQVYLDDPQAPPFDIKKTRKVAELLQKRPDFQAVLRCTEPEELRRTLASGDPDKMKLFIGGSRDRYALTDNAKEQLRALGNSMPTENRSKEWKNLRAALTNPNATK